MVRGEIMEKSLINPLKEAQKEYQELIGKYGKLYSENCCLKLSILEIKEENERLKQQIEKMKSCSNCKNYFKCENDKITNKVG
jgi:hypothetical protein